MLLFFFPERSNTYKAAAADESSDSSTEAGLSTDTEISSSHCRHATSSTGTRSNCSDSEHDSGSTAAASIASKASAPRQALQQSAAAKSVAFLLQWRAVLGACANPLGPDDGFSAELVDSAGSSSTNNK